MCDVNKEVKINRLGTLYGIGIGPGDPELVTLKALKILKMVDIIFAPKASTKSSSIAREIVERLVDAASIEELVFPMTRDKDELHRFWGLSAHRVYSALSSGRDAAFITLGDPLIYSTYSYLLRYLRREDEDLHIVTIPGISAINAAASAMEIPIAEGDERFVIMPLPKEMEELKDALRNFDTVIILKIGKDLERLKNFLMDEGLGESSYFINRIGTDEEYYAKGMSLLKQDASGYLSTMIIRTGT
ncbi:MAG: precorrin-2 C(20)-methyltransferase [Spirochaetota bacterium]|nr:precorrin-2 C(20)-methyltransferase [Spirochaetota bacterium]